MSDIPAGLPDLATLFTVGEMALPALLNGSISFSAVLVNFESELAGQTVAITGSAPYIICRLSEIAAVAPLDTVTIDTKDWLIREVRPDNSGVVRLTVEAVP